MSRGVREYIGIYADLVKTMFQLMFGIWKVCSLPQPVVTIFGGSRVKPTTKYAQMAQELAAKLVKQNISVITGGGPGIMEAANCGAFKALTPQSKARSVGITVKGLPLEKENMCTQDMISVDYFFARKWLMTQYALAFAVFPGGFGTVEELGEVMTLMQTQKLPGVPIVLIGTEYWKPLLHWLEYTVLKEGLISEADFKMLRVTDNIDEAISILKERCEICMI